jgi:hypothetical protein
MSTYTAIYGDPAEASAVVSRLHLAGIRTDEISLLMSAATQGRHFEIDNKSKALEGVATGGLAGGALGALFGGLTAIGGIALTGGAGLVAVGPMVAALAGAGVGAGTGGFLGGLVGLGLPKHEATLIDDRLANGSVLVAVAVDDDDDERVAPRAPSAPPPRRNYEHFNPPVEWQRLECPDGRTFFRNVRTNELVWATADGRQ